MQPPVERRLPPAPCEGCSGSEWLLRVPEGPGREEGGGQVSMPPLLSPQRSCRNMRLEAGQAGTCLDFGCWHV